MLPRTSPSVIFQPLDDGAVLFAPETEVYFGLNEVGAHIWQLLAIPLHSIDELCARIAERYPDAPPATIRADVEDLIAQLVREGLASADPRGSDAAAGA